MRLASSPKVHRRTTTPAALREPELDASNPAPVTRKVYDASLATVLDSFANFQLSVLAIFEVNDDTLKIDGSALHAQL